MTQHIKNFYLTLFLSISLFANQIDKNIFTFYKAFATCENPFSKMTVYAYTDEEANIVYSDTKIDLKNYSCKSVKRIFENADLYFKDYVNDFYLNNTNDTNEKLKSEYFYSDCAYKNLGFKVLKQEICTSTNEDNIFDEIFILNNQYLITSMDSFFFMFSNEFSNKIQIQNQPLYKEPNENTKTKMYLVKNDVVEILEKKDDWIYILYISKDNKEIKAWIPKNALEPKGSQVD